MAGDKSVYELALAPDGTSWNARENLADVLRSASSSAQPEARRGS